MRGSKPLAQWRVQGRWPASYDRLWESMRVRHGRQGAARAMVAVIGLGREFGHARLEVSIAQALELGSTDIAAIRHLLMSDQLQHPRQLLWRSVLCRPTSARCRPWLIDQLLSGCSIEIQP